MKQRVLAILLVAVAAWSVSALTWAQQGFPIDDADPESSVPEPEEANARPMEMGYWVMEVTARGEAAAKKGEHTRAARYFRAIARAVPDRASGFSKACAAHQAAGELEQALDVCRVALTRDGVRVADFLRFVAVMLKRQEPLSDQDVEDVQAAIDHVRDAPDGDDARALILIDLECRLGVKVEDMQRIQTCLDRMRTLAPTDPRLHVYAAVTALHARDWKEAQAVIERARKAGLPEEAIAEMERNLQARKRDDATAGSLRAGGGPPWWPAAVVSVLVVGLLALALRRRAADRASAQG